MRAHYFKPFLAILASALLLVGCKSEKPPEPDDLDSFALPTAGFTTNNYGAVNEGTAGTLYIRVDVDLPNGYKESFLAENGRTEENFILDISVNQAEKSTADSSDYSLGTVFFSGKLDDPYFLIPVTIINDDEVEETETLYLTFESEDVNPSTRLHTTILITIQDNDTAKTVRFSEENIATKEGDTVELDVTLSEAYSAPLTIPIEFSGTATPSVDFNINNGTYRNTSGVNRALTGSSFSSETDVLKVTIPENTTGFTIPLKILDDGFPEGPEYITLSLGADESEVYSPSSEGSDSRISIISNYQLNDTGVTRFSNGSTIQGLSTEDLDYPNQDASHGNVLNSNLTQGFDLTFLDLNGNGLTASTSTDADLARCTRDNFTGLTWVNLAPMLDDDSNGISDTLEQSINYMVGEDSFTQNVSGHYITPSDLVNTSINRMYQNLKYFYSDSDTNRNGGYAGRNSFDILYTSEDVGSATTQESIQNLPTSQFCLPAYSNNDSSSESNCSTESLVSYLNSVSWCGKTNWRLPGVHELISITNFAEGANAFNPFTNVLDNSLVLSRSTVPNSKGSVLCLNTHGEVKYCNKFEAATVIPVAETEE